MIWLFNEIIYLRWIQQCWVILILFWNKHSAVNLVYNMSLSGLHLTCSKTIITCRLYFYLVRAFCVLCNIVHVLFVFIITIRYSMNRRLFKSQMLHNCSWIIIIFCQIVFTAIIWFHDENNQSWTRCWPASPVMVPAQTIIQTFISSQDPQTVTSRATMTMVWCWR